GKRAGGRCGAVDRRARRIPGKLARAEDVSALRAVRKNRGGLPQERPGAAAVLRQALVVLVGEGEADVRLVAGVEDSVHGGVVDSRHGANTGAGDPLRGEDPTRGVK